MKHWPPGALVLSAQQFAGLVAASYGGEGVTEEQVLEAFGELQLLMMDLPKRPAEMSTGRQPIGSKYLEDCAAICAMKGERDDRSPQSS